MIETKIDNPYLVEVMKFPRDEIEWKYRKIWRPEPYPWRGELPQKDGKAIRRDDLCREYAWSIPDVGSLNFVAKWLRPKAVEIGAGTGYWASLLSQMGVDMLCYDIQPPAHTGGNWYHSPRNDKGDLTHTTRKVWHDVRSGNHLMAAEHTDRTLFLCWPPYDNDMAHLTLQAYRGQRLVYIGEGDGGCTADEAFFALLGEAWHVVEDYTPMQWSGIHDSITVYERDVETE